MKKLFFAVLSIFAAVPAFAADLAGGLTEMAIKQVTPGVANVTLTNVAGVWLENEPGTKAKVFRATDESGKGTAKVVTYAADPGLFKGRLLCLTGVGPNWARGKSKFDVSRMSCAPMNDTVTLKVSVPQAAFGSTFGLVPVVVGEDGTLLAWGSHPFGPTRFSMKRPDGTRDVITLLKADKDGNFLAASKDDAAAYQASFYAKIF
jgi:hypothetical protein